MSKTKFEKWKKRALGNREVSDAAEKVLKDCWDSALEAAKKPSQNLLSSQGGTGPIKANIHNKIDQMKNDG